MKVASVADLRNDFRRVSAWISDGETVEIKRRGKPFATLIPAQKALEKCVPKIDFSAQLKEIWGEKVFSREEVAEMRRAQLDGEDG